MRGTIHLDIGAAHLSATFKPDRPGWIRRAGHAVGNRLQRWRRPATQTEANPSPMEHMHTEAHTETASWTSGATRAETLAVMLEAATHAIEALRERLPASQGCPLIVRMGLSSSCISIAPVDFTSPFMRSDTQVQAVAKALVREAMGADAPEQQVRWRMQADQMHLCVITLESSMIQGLQAWSTAQRLKLASCQPAIAGLLDSELQASQRQRDARTLMWTESEPSGRRHAVVTFIRLVHGSAVSSWRTVTPSAPSGNDPEHTLETVLQRFLIASGADAHEKIVRHAWPAHAPHIVAAATVEVRS
ncbi:hypothetical protein [Polaromonas sp.]|uniref:hypothetical protein n=1 Tax=Polaromonas sp. TaxID=1869339 RepID=UPI003266F64E